MRDRDRDTQSEFDLSNPDQIRSIEGFAPDIFLRLEKLQTQGAIWDNLITGPKDSPGFWKITLRWPNSLPPPEPPKSR